MSYLKKFLLPEKCSLKEVCGSAEILFQRHCNSQLLLKATEEKRCDV